MKIIEKKLLKIDINTEKEVSFEEMIVKFDPLIKSIINQWSAYDCDEIKQICLIGLWKAFDKYDITRATTFGFFAKRVMVNDVYFYCKKNIINYTDISINDNCNSQSNENFVSYELDLDSVVTYENSLYEVFLSSYLSILPETYINLFNLYYLKHLTQDEIAETLNLTQPAISYRLKHLSIYVQRMYEVDKLLERIPTEYANIIAEIYILENIEIKLKKLDLKDAAILNTSLSNIRSSLLDINIEKKYLSWIDEVIKKVTYYISLNTISNNEDIECISEVGSIQLNLFNMLDSVLKCYNPSNKNINFDDKDKLAV